MNDEEPGEDFIGDHPEDEVQVRKWVTTKLIKAHDEKVRVK